MWGSCPSAALVPHWGLVVQVAAAVGEQPVSQPVASSVSSDGIGLGLGVGCAVGSGLSESSGVGVLPGSGSVAIGLVDDGAVDAAGDALVAEGDGAAGVLLLGSSFCGHLSSVSSVLGMCGFSAVGAWLIPVVTAGRGSWAMPLLKM